MSLRSLLDGYTSCDATYRRGYCLPYDIDLQASQPQFENGSVSRPIRPTKLYKIKNIRIEIQLGSVGSTGDSLRQYQDSIGNRV